MKIDITLGKQKKKLTEKEFEKQLSEIQKQNVQKEYQRILKEESNKYNQKRKVETSKAIAIYLVVLLNTIILYAMIAMWFFKDLTYLGVLITDIAAQIMIYGIYCLKAYHSKKQEENVKLEREKMSGSLSELLNAGKECAENVVLKNDIVIESKKSAVG